MTDWKVVSPWRSDWEPATPDEVPPVDDSGPRLSDEEAARLIGYLDAAKIVLRTTKLGVDPLSDTGAPVVPTSLRTDGEWIWNDSLTYFVKTYHIAPKDEFLNHVRERGYQMPDLSTIDAEGVLRFLRS